MRFNLRFYICALANVLIGSFAGALCQGSRS
jgi:hypothetical protein